MSDPTVEISEARNLDLGMHSVQQIQDGSPVHTVLLCHVWYPYTVISAAGIHVLVQASVRISIGVTPCGSFQLNF